MGEYPMVRVDGVLKFEHRVVMERHIGRPLRKGEHVHHIDEDKTNNDISNLQIVSPEEHGRIHRTKERACLRCGRSFETGEYRCGCDGFALVGRDVVDLLALEYPDGGGPGVSAMWHLMRGESHQTTSV